MSLLHKLKWRYATKKFDIEQEVSEEDITELIKAMNLTASSYGLQPFKFIIIKNKELQNKLVEASYGQTKVGEASHVIVLAAKTSITEKDIDEYINRIAEVQETEKGGLLGHAQTMKDAIVSLPQDEQLIWAQKQCYITLGTLLLACADLKIDAGPMEGFEPEKYDQLLELDTEGLRSTVVIPIGYRSQNDKYQHKKKVRRTLDSIVELKYKE